jgi:hypothetical protein
VEPEVNLGTPTAAFRKLKFEEVFEEIDDSTSNSLPDMTQIEALANELYPIMVARHSPLPDSLKSCSKMHCTATSPLYSCSDCFHPAWYCKECLLVAHENNPFHQIHEWNENDQCKVPTTLYDLGLAIRLVHADGKECRSNSLFRDLKVLHWNGLHQVRYIQCSCDASLATSRSASARQLMANQLFPATHNAPTTAFTFQALMLFDILNLLGYINIKQFCDSITSNVPDDFKSEVNITTVVVIMLTSVQASGNLRGHFHQCIRLWRLFKSMELKGYKNYQDLASGIVDLCPACPHPNINIPDNWANHKYR